MEAKKLFLANDNNRLQCDAFTQVHFAPEQPIRESDMSRLYVVRINDVDVFLQMVDLIRIPFKNIGSLVTLPASGKESAEWKRDFLKLYPSTTDETPMAVYMYRKLKDSLD